MTILLVVITAACGGSETADAIDTSDLSPQEKEGLALFRIHCATCHETGSDLVIVGPSLFGIATRAETRIDGVSTENYLRTSILQPYDYLVEGYTETMPPDFGKRLTGEEFDAVLAFIQTLK